MNIRIFFAAFAAFVVLFCSETFAKTLFYDGVAHEYDLAPTKLIINGKEITELPMEPVNLNGRVYVPAREVFEALGSTVVWVGETNQVYISYGNKSVILTINVPILVVNDKLVDIDAAPKNINDKTMIPVRAAAENLDFLVEWDSANNAVIITSPNATPSPSPSPTPYPNDKNPEPELPAEPESPTKSNDVSVAEIPVGQFPETKISGIILPEYEGRSYAVITADSAISRVDKFILADNRLVIDIYNAENLLPLTEYPTEGVNYLSTVRVGQNQLEPVKITRIVFDLTKTVSFSVSISDDRKNITVSFERNYISNVLFSTDGITDRIVIEGTVTPAVSIFPLESPKRLVVDIPLAQITESKVIESAGLFVNSVRAAQFDSQTARIVIDLKKEANYTVENLQNTTTIKISETTYENIDFSHELSTLSIKKDPYMPLDINLIQQEDRYYEYKYVITLPGDYSGYLGYGERLVNDGLINSIEISTTDGKTKIVFNEEKILAFDIKQDNDNIYITAMMPKDKYSKIIVVDPGHGGSDPGTEGHGIQEKDPNLDISNRLVALLETNKDIKVYATRVSDVYPSLTD
ncbi:MAG: N-acetylmuramoyl-L-alanine amidase family protein, partial [Clostridiales bacterium]|nr:N-acetylmuramoyl-L-alanine amidase family protein [Clostridiales bacterium]